MLQLSKSAKTKAKSSREKIRENQKQSAFHRFFKMFMRVPRCRLQSTMVVKPDGSELLPPENAS